MKKSIRKIIIAAAVLFSAGFTTSANAQVAEVYERPNFRTPIGDGGSTPFIDASGTIEEICAPTYGGNRLAWSSVIRRDSNGAPGPGIDSRCTTVEGELIWIISAYSPRNYDGPFRVYRTRNGQLAPAQQKLDFNGDAVLKTGSELNYPTEFFMMSTFVETNAAINALGSNSGTQIGDNGDTQIGDNGDTQIGDNNGGTQIGDNSNDDGNSGGNAGGGGSSGAGAIIGGVAVVGGLIWLLSSGGEEGEFNFSHDFGYSATESSYSANIGGQMDFRKDNWHLYFSGDGSIDGKFRYQSGGSYTADFWTAEFSESVSGKTADYDLSLSSDFGSGIWKLSPTYRLHSEYADNEFDTQNSLNLESEFRYNNWEIRPTAGFNWREFGEFANSGTFRINAVHRF